jgi:methyl-accepting chemotaxis protein
MKVNMPITNNEIELKETTTIVSATDLKGIITSVNRDFIEFSGYTEKELIGHSHNIVRHPDMPPAAFADLWQTMKAGKPWTGIVKNRCKNGDYYWVEANVTPLRENGDVVGYMSVRNKPTLKQIEQAQALYRAINEGRAPKPGLIQAIRKKVQNLPVRLKLQSAPAIPTLFILLSAIAFKTGMDTIALGLIGGGAIIGVILGALVSRSIVLPLRQATQALKTMSEGNLNVKFDIARDDEVGQVMQALRSVQIKIGNDMNETRKLAEESIRVRAMELAAGKDINALVEAAINGELSSRISLEGKTGFAHELAENINKMLDAVVEPLDVAAQYVDDISKGNIPSKITGSYNGYFNIIKNNLNTCIDAVNALINDTQLLSQAALEGNIQTRADANRHHGDFRKIVEGVNATLETIVTPIITVKTVVDSISTAAREISVGNADLSQRTEQQAASLEETAASMEELASTVKQNADSAKQATQMAVEASNVAVKGGDIVQQVINTMSAINDSAGKIVEIISVIDGIALQTNILALNAAVEAARAGEQGRGFAVVASEVRNLAQRSAAAAKEIKGLIGDSAEKVEDGSKLVGEAGKTMDEIVVSVKRVTDLMSVIAAASAEQSSGIDQVNKAMTQMDEVTQQNAALVEQAAAAAESLEEQAATLSESVAQFHLDSDIRSPVPRRTASPALVLHRPAPRLTGSPAKLRQQNDDKWVEF